MSTVDDVRQALYREAQLALRAVVGARELDTFLMEKDGVAGELAEMVRARARALGVELIAVGNRAIRSRIAPLKKFARNLKTRLDGVLAHCRWPLHTSLLEGINNKIKVIKRMAYGFRDD